MRAPAQVQTARALLSAPLTLGLAAASPALATQALWLSTNTQLPVADAAPSLFTAFQIYRSFMTDPLGEAVWNVYAIRSYRTTALHWLEAPFLFVSGGDLMLAVAGVTLLCTAITCLYLYNLLRLALSAPFAMLGAAFLSLLAAVQWPATRLGFTEIAFMPAVLATIYHLICSDHLRRPRHTAAFALAAGLACMFRPVESLTHIGPPILFLLIIAAWKRIVSVDQLLSALLVVLGGLCLIMGAGLNANAPEPSPIFDIPERGALFLIAAYTVFAATAVAAAAKLALMLWRLHRAGWRIVGPAGWLDGAIAPPFVAPAALGVTAIAVAYYIGFVPLTVDWLYSTSLGELAAMLAPPSKSEIVLTYARYAGLVPLASVTSLAALTLGFAMAPAQRASLARNPVLLLAMVMPVAFALIVGSVQYFPRKITIVVLCFFVLATLAALSPGRLRLVRAALVGALAIAQFAGLTWIGSGRPHTALLSQVIGDRLAFPTMVKTRPNPHEIMLDFVSDTASRNGLRVVGLSNFTSEVTRGEINPPLMGLMSSTRMDENVRVAPFRRLNADLSNFDKQTRGMQAFLLVNDVPQRFTMGEREAARLRAWAAKRRPRKPALAAAFEMLARRADGTLTASLGLRPIGCAVIPTSGREACLYARAATSR